MFQALRQPRSWLGLVLLALSLAGANAQGFSLAENAQPVISLAGQWRFERGDDPAWAASAYDDSRWGLISSTRTLEEQGQKPLDGLAWYRFRVTIPAGSDPYAISLPSIAFDYEVYADGQRVYAQGRMPPLAAVPHSFPRVLLPIGRATRPNPQTIQVALRVWADPKLLAGYAAGLNYRPDTEIVGPLSLLDARYNAYRFSFNWIFSADLGLAILEGLGCLVTLALFLLRVSDRAYLWFSLYAATQAYVFTDSFLHYNTTYPSGHLDGVTIARGLSSTVGAAAYLLFVRLVLNGKNGLLFKGVLGVSLIAGLSSFGDQMLIHFPHLNLLLIFLFLSWTCLGYVVGLQVLAIRRRVPDARILLVATLGEFLTYTVGLLASLEFTLRGRVPEWLYRLVVSLGSFGLDLTAFAEIVIMLSVLTLLILRFARVRHEGERMTQELEAARTVQQVLVPEQIPVIPGYSIDHAYLPAQEVGGDFFQILPIAEGGAILAIGDVSGKGLQAAMHVALIIGALRTLAELSHAPGAILEGLNRRLYGRGAGFTTALVLRLGTDGELTLASAGHLAPYLDREEIALPPALPLGLVKEARYEEVSLRLPAGAYLTLMTDGFVEAQSKTKGLLGFRGTEELLTQGAEAIAAAACKWGQSDDITVLTVRFEAARRSLSELVEALA